MVGDTEIVKIFCNYDYERFKHCLKIAIFPFEKNSDIVFVHDSVYIITEYRWGMVYERAAYFGLKLFPVFLIIKVSSNTAYTFLYFP